MPASTRVQPGGAILTIHATKKFNPLFLKIYFVIQNSLHAFLLHTGKRHESQHRSAGTLKPCWPSFPDCNPGRRKLRFGNRVEMALPICTTPSWRSWWPAIRPAASPCARRQLQLPGQQALAAGARALAKDELDALAPALARYLIDGALRGWLFSAQITGKPLAYVVSRLDYTRHREDETGKVFIELKGQFARAVGHRLVRLSAADIAGRTWLPRRWRTKVLIKGKPRALLASYDEAAERYFDWRARYGAQFSARGGLVCRQPTATHRDTDYARKDVVILSSTASRRGWSTTKAFWANARWRWTPRATSSTNFCAGSPAAIC